MLTRTAATEFQLCCVTSAGRPEHSALVCKDAVDELLLWLLVVRRLAHWRSISQVSQMIGHHSRLDVAAAIRYTTHCWLVHHSLTIDIQLFLSLSLCHCHCHCHCHSLSLPLSVTVTLCYSLSLSMSLSVTVTLPYTARVSLAYHTSHSVGIMHSIIPLIRLLLDRCLRMRPRNLDDSPIRSGIGCVSAACAVSPPPNNSNPSNLQATRH